MILSIYHQAETWLSKLHRLHPIVSLTSRIYITKVFFAAGLLKIRDWDTTLFLFEEEYQVPVLSPTLAAYLGTFGELVFPVLLLIGLTTRFAALGLFVVNIVAVLALPEIPTAALYLHIIWGLLLLHLAVYGGGLISIDRWLTRMALDHRGTLAAKAL